MDSLINIEQRKINKTLIETVSARELYKKLELAPSQFSRWIKVNLLNNEFFKENIDFIGVRLEVEGNKVMDYYITLDVAKHLCMLSKSEYAHKIREYFIFCEKEYSTKARKRVASIRERYGLTDKIQELYGDKIETNKINGIKDWTYSNYTCLVYKKVFGVNNATKVKQMYHLSDKENIRESDKIPEEKKDEITNTEYSLHCYLQTLRCLNTPLDEVYDKVKQFLLQISLDK